MILLNFPISKLRILDLLRFERVSSLFSASFFFASFLLCFSALLFFSGHPTITPSFHLPFASRIARELQVNRTGGTLSVQFSCSKSYMGDRPKTARFRYCPPEGRSVPLLSRSVPLLSPRRPLGSALFKRVPRFLFSSHQQRSQRRLSVGLTLFSTIPPVCDPEICRDSGLR